MELCERFQDEKLAQHWQVDETIESFNLLMQHLKVKTNMYKFFQEPMERLGIASDEKEKYVVADIGCGVGWTTAILAGCPAVKHVYGIDPSRERLKHAKYVLQHYKVPEGKATLIDGTFTDLKIEPPVDLFVLNGAIHHCFDDDIPALFDNIRKLMSKGARVLISNEHYVNHLWSTFLFAVYMKNFRRRDKLAYTLSRLRAPSPFSGDHWRTRKELDDIFRR
jgi:SAM-dependent methyltransferase